MAGSGIGTLFHISTWGESHGAGVGVAVDGCPAGLPLTTETIQKYLNRRKPGQTRYATPRKEEDLVELLSGVFEGRTTGTPIAMMVRNQNQRSHDYSQIAGCYRPGHADYSYDQKYGFRDYRGGGRSSGRETIGRVAGGAVALEALKELGVTVTAYTKAIGDIVADPSCFSKEKIAQSPLYMPDPEASQRAERLLEQRMKEQDSVGGVVECIVEGLPAGVGEPVFDRLDAELAKAVMSIGAVKGVEFGEGFHAAELTGFENNDAFCSRQGQIQKKTNHAGGILGGISDGSPILLRAAFKPTPSIARTQETVSQVGEELEISIRGRHDPIIVPRAVVVVEAMVGITVLDMLMRGMASRLDRMKEFYHGIAIEPDKRVL